MYPQPGGKPDRKQVLASKSSATKDSMLVGRAGAVVGVGEQVVAEAGVALDGTVISAKTSYLIHLHLDHLLS